MTRLLPIFAVLLALGAYHPAHAEVEKDDDHGGSTLPAPDFGWATLGVVAVAATGLTLARRSQSSR